MENKETETTDEFQGVHPLSWLQGYVSEVILGGTPILPFLCKEEDDDE